MESFEDYLRRTGQTVTSGGRNQRSNLPELRAAYEASKAEQAQQQQTAQATELAQRQQAAQNVAGARSMAVDPRLVRDTSSGGPSNINSIINAAGLGTDRARAEGRISQQEYESYKSGARGPYQIGANPINYNKGPNLDLQRALPPPPGSTPGQGAAPQAGAQGQGAAPQAGAQGQGAAPHNWQYQNPLQAIGALNNYAISNNPAFAPFVAPKFQSSVTFDPSPFWRALT